MYRQHPEDALPTMHAPSDINHSVLWLFPKHKRCMLVAVGTGYTEQKNTTKANSYTWTEQRYTPSSGRILEHKTVALLAIDLVQESNIRHRGQRREGVEESESMQRSPVTQQSTATNSSSPLV